MLLCTACLIFWTKFLAFVGFAFCGFASVPLPGFSQFYLVMFCFFLCSGLFAYIILITTILFVVLGKFFWIYLLGFVIAFFCCKNQCVAPICACSFCFLCVFFPGCVQLRFWYDISKSFATLTYPKLSPPPSPFDFFDTPKSAPFFCNSRVLPNIVIRAHFGIF